MIIGCLIILAMIFMLPLVIMLIGAVKCIPLLIALFVVMGILSYFAKKQKEKNDG